MSVTLEHSTFVHSYAQRGGLPTTGQGIIFNDIKLAVHNTCIYNVIIVYIIVPYSAYNYKLCIVLIIINYVYFEGLFFANSCFLRYFANTPFVVCLLKIHFANASKFAKFTKCKTHEI